MLKSRALRIHFLALAAFSAALFLPMMGRGFVLDDFGHVYVAAFHSVRFGLTRASGGPYYAPLAWLSFRIDWLLWGARPFPWAVSNLLIHIVNTLLLYCLALRLWRSHVAAWWAAFGFALLFPANANVVMWIATRAHLIVALFYLAAMLATLWFIRTERSKIFAWVAVVTFAALSIFAKESGVTVLAAVAVIIFYERGAHDRRASPTAIISLFAALFIVLILYLGLRSQSGARPIFPNDPTHPYVLSLKVMSENLLKHGRRTYALLSLAGVAITASLLMRGLRPRLRSLTKYDVLLSVMLFASALTPFIFKLGTPEHYSYLPGIGAVLLLAAVTRSLYETPSGALRRPTPVTLAPIVILVVIYVAFTVVYSSKWIQLAKVNTTVLRQIAAQQPEVKANTFVVLAYSEIDLANRFPEGFSHWCFPYALRVLYADRTLDGKIIRQGEPYSIGNKLSEIRFSYISSTTPTVVKTGEVSPR